MKTIITVPNREPWESLELRLAKARERMSQTLLSEPVQRVERRQRTTDRRRNNRDE